MATSNTAEDLDAALSAIVRSKARRLRSAQWTVEDHDDHVQDCIVELLRKLPFYRADRAPLATFANRILANLVANQLRDRQALKRNPGILHRLDSQGPAAEDTTRSATLSDLERTELRLDLEAVFQQLPPDLRLLAERLMRQTVSEISRQTKVPRSTVQSRVRRLRSWFEQHDLRDFL